MRQCRQQRHDRYVSLHECIVGAPLSLLPLTNGFLHLRPPGVVYPSVGERAFNATLTEVYCCNKCQRAYRFPRSVTMSRSVPSHRPTSEGYPTQAHKQKVPTSVSSRCSRTWAAADVVLGCGWPSCGQGDGDAARAMWGVQPPLLQGHGGPQLQDALGRGLGGRSDIFRPMVSFPIRQEARGWPLPVAPNAISGAVFTAVLGCARLFLDRPYHCLEGMRD